MSRRTLNYCNRPELKWSVNVIAWVDRDESSFSGKVDVAQRQLAREESLKLVQRLFLGQGAQRPRAKIFAGIDRGNVGALRLCGETARALAENITGSVCALSK